MAPTRGGGWPLLRERVEATKAGRSSALDRYEAAVAEYHGE